MISEYTEAGVNPENVWPQSFLLDDVVFWVNQMPEFGNQAVFLDQKANDPDNVSMAYMEGLAQQGSHFGASDLENADSGWQSADRTV